LTRALHPWSGLQLLELTITCQVESPTGTGKSLTLLTATLTWLAANQKRLDVAAEANLRARLSADDPDGRSGVSEAG
jgi:chromosome transmission fidelity protein 1